MVFALTPAQHFDGLLDFDEKSHRSVYAAATNKLHIDPFDCEQSQLVDFMSALSKKAHDFGWLERVMKIPKSLPEDANTEYVNLLTNRAQISIETVKAYDLSYVDHQTRERQDMQCIYTCIMDSLSQEGRLKVITEK